MKRMFSFMAAALVATSIQAQLPAFPGAEGFGALATGGRDSKTIVHVTNLNATGTGSLTEALNGDNRIVVFDVGGIIKLTPDQMVAIDNHKNVTVLGQTAPGQGITIYGNRVLIRNCSNVIFRYIRMRGSINMAKDAETLTMDNAENVILDHCDISWGRWDNVHIKEANNITWQYCIISEGIDPQRFGAITDGTRNWTISHCLWIDNHSRNPKMKCYAQMINSVVYNGGNGAIGGHSSADNYQDLINNYFIAGPSGGSAYSQWTSTDHLYQSGNLMDSNMDGVLNGSLYTNTSATNMDYCHFSPTIPVTVETPLEAYNAIIEQVGCSRVRDIHDARLINQLKSLGTEGKIIDSEEDVGGIGTLDGGTAPQDTDGDGMSDAWETANGLNANDASDALLDSDGDGYLNIEEYANSLAATTSYLIYPSGLKISHVGSDATTVLLRWTNVEDRAIGILVEKSLDGENFEQIDSLAASKEFVYYTGLDSTKMYYYRLRTTDGTHHSNYTEVVSINQPEGTVAGGGTKMGTRTFVPKAGKLYRIINYASKFYNSAAAISGAANYMVASNNKLSSTTEFDWQNPSLLWTITRDTKDTTKYSIRTFSTKEAFSPTVTDSYIVTSDTITSQYNINFVGNLLPALSGKKDSLAFFRINTPENKNYQIRGKSATQWIWGGGTIIRADMIFTIQEIDSTLIGLYTKNLKATVEEAETLLKGATAGTGTLNYPEDARDAFVAGIEDADNYLSNYKILKLTQHQLDSVEAVLKTQITTFKAQQITYWTDYDATKVYNIYSYGTAAGNGAATATSTTARRYLTAEGNNLTYHIGNIDENETADTVRTYSAAQWFVTPNATKLGWFAFRNVATGEYLQVNTTLNASPTEIFTTYNNTDNSKYAFSLRRSDDSNYCLNVGDVNDDKVTGPVVLSSVIADRTRLRWIFEEVGNASATGIQDIQEKSQSSLSPWYNLQGQQITSPRQGVYIHQGKKIILK